MMTNEQIRIKADEILNKYVPKGGAYKKFDNIMSAENIKFREITTSNDFLGIFTHGNNGQPYIMINTVFENEGRRNFTIAHELGHYFLCHDLKCEQCYDADIYEEGIIENPIEQEANLFASYLLMPESKIKPAFLSMLQHSHKAKNKTILYVQNNYTWGIWCGFRNDLMKRYGVSETALRYRLINLGLVKFSFDTSGTPNVRINV